MRFGLFDDVCMTHRVYDTKNGPKEYRFSSLEGNNWPKNLEFFDLISGEWQKCPNINIAKRISLEVLCKDSHHFSRYTADSVYCKDCGLVKSYNEYLKSP